MTTIFFVPKNTVVNADLLIGVKVLKNRNPSKISGDKEMVKSAGESPYIWISSYRDLI